MPSNRRWRSSTERPARTRPGRPTIRPHTITPDDQGSPRSGVAVDRRVFAAVLHEFVDQQWILPEVKMHVAGEQVRCHEPLVTDHIALGVLHLVGGFEATVVPSDSAPMELMPAIELTTG